MFDEKSRYKDLPLATYADADGRERRYVTRRFLPQPESLRTLVMVTVTDTDRLDLIAHARLGEATASWRVGDANAAMDPDDLLQPVGRRLRVPSPI
jgi:hypothetical protein